VLSAVSEVLRGSPTPLRACDIWRTVGALLDGRVPKSSVYEALSTHSRMQGGRFRRVAYGLYEYRAERLTAPATLPESHDAE
jgi:hypothetical protein